MVLSAQAGTPRLLNRSVLREAGNGTTKRVSFCPVAGMTRSLFIYSFVLSSFDHIIVVLDFDINESR